MSSVQIFSKRDKSNILYGKPPTLAALHESRIGGFWNVGIVVYYRFSPLVTLSATLHLVKLKLEFLPNAMAKAGFAR